MFQETKYAKQDVAKALGPRVSPERKQWVKKESAMLLAKNVMTRDMKKENIFKERKERDLMNEAVREERIRQWERRTKNSPFAVDLVAETERIIEESEIRTKEERERRAQIETRRSKAKNDLILKALSEFSDLEALRREKRAIMEEEQRLKALLELEKTSVDRKSERLAAENAQRLRQHAKSDHRRQLYKDSLDSVMQEEAEMLKKKNGIPLAPVIDFDLRIQKRIEINHP